MIIIYLKLSNRLSKSQSGILVNKIFDHIPYFISADNITIKQRNTKQFIQIKKQSPADILNFKAELSHADFDNRLDQHINSDPNNNYNLLEKTMTDAMNKYMPTKTIKFNKHKHKKTHWITRGIVKSIKYRDQLYQKLKETDQNSVEHQIIALNLKTYNKILKNNIRLAKMNYYISCFEKCKHNIKKTWETINDVMNRERKSELPESFNING